LFFVYQRINMMQNTVLIMITAKSVAMKLFV
jgi:hypothetical protein